MEKREKNREEQRREEKRRREALKMCAHSVSNTKAYPLTKPGSSPCQLGWLTLKVQTPEVLPPSNYYTTVSSHCRRRRERPNQQQHPNLHSPLSCFLVPTGSGRSISLNAFRSFPSPSCLADALLPSLSVAARLDSASGRFLGGSVIHGHVQSRRRLLRVEVGVQELRGGERKRGRGGERGRRGTKEGGGRGSNE